MSPAPHVIVGWMALAFIALGLVCTVDYWWRHYARPWLYGDDRWDTAESLTDDTGADIGDIFEQPLDDWRDVTQPWQAFHDETPDGPVIATARVGGVFLPLSEDVPRPVGLATPPRGTHEENSYSDRPGYPFTQDVPRPVTDRGKNLGPGYPFQPHAGPPAWSPRHAKTSWVDELITECLGAPSVEIYMWQWQQRHRLAVTA